jgi:hypothetical protein
MGSMRPSTIVRSAGRFRQRGRRWVRNMEQTIPLKEIAEQLDRPVDRVIERLLEENAQLRDLVTQLTRIAIRNVVERHH